MNYKVEATEIIKIALVQDTEAALLNVLNSLAEEADCSGTTFEEIKQFISDLIEEIKCPELDEKELEDPILEVYSKGVLDS